MISKYDNEDEFYFHLSQILNENFIDNKMTDDSLNGTGTQKYLEIIVKNPLIATLALSYMYKINSDCCPDSYAENIIGPSIRLFIVYDDLSYNINESVYENYRDIRYHYYMYSIIKFSNLNSFAKDFDNFEDLVDEIKSLNTINIKKCK